MDLHGLRGGSTACIASMKLVWSVQADRQHLHEDACGKISGSIRSVLLQGATGKAADSGARKELRSSLFEAPISPHVRVSSESGGINPYGGVWQEGSGIHGGCCKNWCPSVRVSILQAQSHSR